MYSPVVTNVEQLEENLRKVGDATWQYTGSMEKNLRLALQRQPIASNFNEYNNEARVLLSVVSSCPPLAEMAPFCCAVIEQITEGWKTRGAPKILIYATSAMLALKLR